jgi:hypothetical protein
MFTRPIALISAHFERHKCRGKGQFFWRLSLERFVLSAMIMIPILALFDLPPRTDLLERSPYNLIVGAVVMAPFFETLLLQAFPIMLARRFGFGFWAQVAVSIPCFAIPHSSAGLGTVIGAGIIGGFYFGFTYAHWRAESFRSAFWMTSGMHALHNGLLVALILLWLK